MICGWWKIPEALIKNPCKRPIARFSLRTGGAGNCQCTFISNIPSVASVRECETKRNYARGRLHVVTWGGQNLHIVQRDAWHLHFFPKKANSTLLSATERKRGRTAAFSFLTALSGLALSQPALAANITVASPVNGTTVPSPVWIRAHNIGCDGLTPTAFGYSIDSSSTLTKGVTVNDIDVTTAMAAGKPHGSFQVVDEQRTMPGGEHHL